MTDQREPVSIIIDGSTVDADRGDLIITAAERYGIHIPRFCYHPRMRPVAFCRMCLVEVKGPRGFSLQPACFVNVAPDMEIVTNSEKVKKAQDGVLEYLLANHPLDCPVCDKGGECPLQDQTLSFGPSETRFIEEKRHYAKPIPISELILLDRERCIQCDRCTRFADEVAGEPLIEFIGRGANIEVATFPDLPFRSYFSGNVVQICPVGALTATPYRFKARPWDLEQVESTCTMCALGCRTVVQSSQNQLTRYLGVDIESVNHSWLCDKGRFSFEAINSEQRLTSPMVRKGEGFVETGWAESLAKVAKAVRASLEGVGPESVAAIGGSHWTNEDLYAWVKLLKGTFGTDSVDCQLGDGLDPEIVVGAAKATINEALASKLLIVVAGDLREELPVLWVRLRDAVLNHGLKVIEVSSRATSVTPLAAKSIRYNPGHLREALQSISFAELATEIGLDEIDPEGRSVTVLAGRGNLAENQANVSLALTEFLRSRPQMRVLLGLRRSNVVGATMIGLSPGRLPGQELTAQSTALVARWQRVPEGRGRTASEILEACRRGEIGVLFLLGADPLGDMSDTEEIRSALDSVDLVVSLDGFVTSTHPLVDVVLPVALANEYEGTTTNIEGRVSFLGQKLLPPGLARPAWDIAAELAEYCGTTLGVSDARELWEELTEVSLTHRGVHRSVVERESEGVVVPLARAAVTPTARPRRLDPIATPGISSVETQAPKHAATVVKDDIDVELVTEDLPSPSVTNIAGEETLASADLAATERGLSLVAYRRLYGGGVHLDNCDHLRPLVNHSVARVSPSTASGYDLVHGGRVVLVRGEQRSAPVEVCVDESVAENLVEVSIDSISRILSLVDSRASMTAIQLERA